MKSSTATGTTATAESTRGRFAPSPTGLLHKGSLVAAVASWLDSRANHGRWLIRIEDLDQPRTVPGAAASILDTLASFGLVSDEPVLWQSTRGHAYRAALERLQRAGLAYRCRCSRSEVSGAYSGHCRDLGITEAGTAWRLRLPDREWIKFHDRIQGRCRYRAAALGDPVLFRRDGIAAYQLAVTVDDAFQQITDVVRGADLLESTAWQVAIIEALELPLPAYAHVPLVTGPDGAKLAKSRNSVAVGNVVPEAALAGTLALLNLELPAHLKAATVSDMLHWAVQHWDPERLAGISAVALAD